MFRARAAFLIASTILFADCTESTAPSHRTAPSESDQQIFDAVHNAGNPHFYFSPPMVATAAYTGSFDASLSPVVDICAWDNGCAAPRVATFTMQTGPGSETVRVSATDQTYVVNWHTDQFNLQSSALYRIRVMVGGAELGHADVQILNNGSAAKNVTTAEYIPLVDGRTLPIKFRIETGAVTVLPPGGGSTSVGVQGATIGTSDAAVALAIPAGALATPTPISITPSPITLGDRAIVAGTSFEFGPTGTTFSVPVVANFTYDPAKIPPGATADMLAVFTATDNGWVEIPGSTVDMGAHTVQAPLNHFSRYAVGARRISFAPGECALGLNQIVGQTITISNTSPSPTSFSLKNANSAITIVEPGTPTQTPGGQTGNYQIPSGSSSLQLNMYGNTLGTDTLIVSAAGRLPDTIVVPTTLGKLILSGWPTNLRKGDSAQLVLIQTLPSGHYVGSGYGTERYALSASSNLVFSQDNAPVTFVDAPGFESRAFYVKAVSGGTGTVTITNANYESLNANVAIQAVWDIAKDFPATNPGGPWSAGFTASLGSDLQRYPDQVDYRGFTSWTNNSIRLYETPDVRKNLTTAAINTVQPGQVAMHPGCHAQEFTVLRFTAPASGHYQVKSTFYQGDDGNTSAYVLRNGQSGAPLFAAASTNSSPTFDGSLFLDARETVDFVVGTADDNCFGDTTPVDIQVVQTP